MPIPGIEQPDILPIDGGLRLRKFDGVYDFALAWYQDGETVWLVDGVREPYTRETLRRMYAYLNERSELYFIEVSDNGGYMPIGDVAFRQEDMPIVVGDKAYRGRGIGRRVVSALIGRGRELGYEQMFVREIYDYNHASARCFEKAGFQPYEKTDKGYKYIFDIRSEAT